ncbi:Nn.00g004490.m01.CDS01 [Neocucurbitaria sp. VM-36]
MRFTHISSTVLLVIGTASAQNSSAAPTSTITVTPGCPSTAPADVMVTRSAVAVPSCDAGNATKPSIVSMPGYGANMTTAGASGSATGSGNSPQFTGAAGKMTSQGAIVVLGGLFAGLML